MTRPCPLCGGGEVPAVKVVLGTNMVWINGQAVVVAPQHAEIAFMIWQAMPGSVSWDELISGLHGRTVPKWAASDLNGQIFRLRRKIKGTGLRITNHQRRGYSMRLEIEG